MNRIALYMGLMESVFAHNAKQVTENQITSILTNLSGPHPVLKKLEIYRDLTLHSGAVGYADIPDKESSMAALRAVLEEYYLILADQGVDDPGKSIRKPIKDYISARWNEVISTHIGKYLPNMVLLDIRKKEGEIAALAPGDKGRRFFEGIFTAYTTDPQTVTVATYKKKLAILKKENIVARAIDMDEEGRVSISVPVEERTVVRGLCSVFNAFVDLAALTLGEEGAAEKAQFVVAPMLKFFSPVPEDTGVLECLIHGRLSQILPVDIQGLGPMLGGGFNRGTTFLFQVPSGIERNLMLSHILADTLSLRGSTLVVTTTRFPGDLRGELDKRSIKATTYEGKGKLVFVDWYSHKSERVVGMDVGKSVVKSGKDLTNLEISLEKGLDMLSGTRLARVMLDSTSSIMRGFDSKSVFSFFQSLKKHASEKHLAVIAFVEKEMHDQKTLSWLHQVFDSVLDVSKTDTGYNMRVLTLRGRNPKTSTCDMRLGMSEMSLDTKEVVTLSNEDIVRMIEEGQKLKTPVPAPKKRPVVEKKTVSTPEEHYRHAVELASKRDYDGARDEFRRAIELNNKYVDAYQALGSMLLYGTTDLDGAVETLEKVVTLQPENGDAWFDIGNAYFKKNMFYEAKKAFLSAVSLKPYYRWYNKKEFLCPSCSTILSTGTRRCPGCGSELDMSGRLVEDKKEPPVANESAEIENPESPGGKGESIEETNIDTLSREDKSSSSSISHGARTESVFLCPVCGNEVGESDPACVSCGALFQEPAPENSGDAPVEAKGIGGTGHDTAQDVENSPEPQEDVIDDDMDLEDPLVLLGREMKQRYLEKDWSSVVECADALIEAAGETVGVIEAKGVALTNLDQGRDALILYREFLKSNPHQKILLGAISHSLFHLGKHEEALRYADMCLKEHPENKLAREVKDILMGRPGE